MRRQRTRWEEDNEPPFNVAALVTVAGIVLGLAALVLVLSLT